MLNPLNGQGLPPAFLPGLDRNLSWRTNDTYLAESGSTNFNIPVHIGAFLDKLLKVNDQDYNFEAVLFIRATWVDPRAREEIYRRTQETYGVGNDALCRRECHSNYHMCCDSVWLPGLDLINAWGLPEERVDYDAIVCNPKNQTVVTWIKRFSGIFYTAMNFRRFPFDSQVLVIDMWAQSKGHRLLPGSTAIKLSTDGKQRSAYSDLSSWKVKKLQLETYAFNVPALLSGVVPSPSDDPWPIESFPEDLSATWDGVTQDSLRIKIHIQRLSGYYVASFILPVVLCVVLSWWTFWISPHQIETRMSVLISLFLALTALQFTISNQLPASTYITVMGWVVIVSYLTIALGTVETVLVYCVFRWYVHRSEEDGGVRDRSIGQECSKRDSHAHSNISCADASLPEDQSVSEREKENEARVGKGTDQRSRPAVAEGQVESSSHVGRWRQPGRLVMSRMRRKMGRSPSLITISRALQQVARLDSDLRRDMSKAKEAIRRIERFCSWVFPSMYVISLGLVIGLTGET